MDFIKQLFTKQDKSFEAETVSMLSTSTLFSSFSDDDIESDMLSNYKKSLYLFKCIDIVANSFSALNFDMYKVINMKGEAEKIAHHEFLDLLHKPNHMQTKNQFLRIWVINMKLSGEAFIRLIRSESGKIEGMVNVRPDIIDVEVNGDGEVEYRVFKPNGVVEKYGVEDIIHTSFPDSTSPLRGAGILRPAHQRVSAEIKGSQLQVDTFANQGRPDGILSVKNLQHDQARGEEIKRTFFNTFSGKNSKRRVAVVDDGTKYQQVSMTQKEMEYMESMNFLRDDIALAVGVPKAFLTTDDVNRANADAAWLQYMKLTIEPLARYFQESTNERIITPFYDDATYIKHEDLVAEDQEMRLEEADKLVDKVFTRNEVRERYGLAPIEGGDVLTTSFGSVPLTAITTPVVIENAFRGRPYLRKKFELKEKLHKALEFKAMKEFITTPSPEFRLRYKNMINDITDKHVKKIEKSMAQFFKNQGKRIADGVEEYQGDDLETTDVFNLEMEAELLRETALPLFAALAGEIGNAGLTPAKMLYPQMKDFTVDGEVLKRINERARLFAQHVTGVSYQKVLNTMTDGASEGLGRIKVAGLLRDVFADMSRVRSVRIARTEGTHMSGLSAQVAFERSEVVVGKEWLSANDDRTRDEHLENHAKIRKNMETFPSGESFPGEESINCRCVLAPVVE